MTDDKAQGRKMSARRERTRARLLGAAREAIAEKGLHATTLDEIAARAGLTKGAIYDNFASKDELFMALVSNLEFGPRWPEGRSGPVTERLRLLAKAVLAENEVTRQQAPIRAEFLLYSLTHPEVKAAMPLLVEAQIARTEAHVRELFDESEITLEPRAFAILLENFIPSLVYTRALAPDDVTEAVVAKIFQSFARA